MNRNSIEQELISQEQAWMEALRRQDEAALDQLLAPDFELISGQWGRIPRAAWLADACSAYKLERFDFDDVAVRNYGDVAVVNARHTQKARWGEHDLDLSLIITDLWRKHDGRWQVALRHVTPTAS